MSALAKLNSFHWYALQKQFHRQRVTEPVRMTTLDAGYLA
jgi:hypothetical protein